MIRRDDFDAWRFPEVRRQLTAAATALQESVSAAWSERQLEIRNRNLVARDCPLCGAEAVRLEVVRLS